MELKFSLDSDDISAMAEKAILNYASERPLGIEQRTLLRAPR